MDELTPPKRCPRFVPSNRLSDRKRALFPSQGNDSDSDLGHMSPLERSSSPDRFQHLFNGRHSVSFRDGFSKMCSSSPESERIEDTDESDDGECFTFFTSRLTRFRSETDLENINPNKMTPRNSPQSTEIPNKTPTLTQSLINYTTILDTPTEILKTPHDSTLTATNVKVPKLVRKSLLDISNIDKSSLKRKSDSPIENKVDKNIKLDPYHHLKAPKARTALFTENIFPAKSFYPKTEINKHEGNFRIDSILKTKRSKKPDNIYLCNRNTKRNKKKSFGMINAGVRHGIRKPKRKSAFTKTQLLKAALNIVKNSPLNAILDNIDASSTCSENGVSLEQVQKMDFILKNVQTRTNSPTPLKEKPQGVPDEGYYNLKRPRSPKSDCGANKKFFKSSHLNNKATVTINRNIKFKLQDGELSLIEKQHKTIRRSKTQPITFDPNDFSFNEDVKIAEESFTNILKSLEGEAAPSGRIINEINSKLLSPTSLMCDLTSGLALDSPKAQINAPVPANQISALKKRISFPDNMANDSSKLFPIFYGKQSENTKPARENKHVKNIRKIWKPLSEDQTLIDAGQTRFGVTQCSECKCVYSLGEPEDEIMHFQHHNSIAVLRYNVSTVGTNFKPFLLGKYFIFKGWKHERVVNQFHNGKVIQINPNDSKVWWKKVKDVLGVVNQELGFVDMPFDSFNKKVRYFFIFKPVWMLDWGWGG